MRHDKTDRRDVFLGNALVGVCKPEVSERAVDLTTSGERDETKGAATRKDFPTGSPKE